VHIPTDGRPLKNYRLALADIERRGNEPSANSLATAKDAGVLTADKGRAAPDHARRNLLAKLFGFGQTDEDEDRELTSSTGRARTPRLVAQQPTVVASVNSEPDKAAPAAVASAVPLPTKRPATTYQLASADEPPRPAQAASLFANATLSPNEIIKRRGYWQGPPDSPSVAPSAAKLAPHRMAAVRPEASAARRRPSLDPDPAATASIAPWPVKPQIDRVSPEIALSYAAQENPRPARGAAAMGVHLPTNLKTAAIPPRTTVATKATKEQPTRALTAQSLLAAALRNRAGGAMNANDPWLRAMVVAPNVRKFMTTALFGTPDFRNLQPLMRKPSSSVMMTFALEPYLGLSADRFTGSAVVFVSTVTFANRTAALR